ncbi:MAG: hypothetical protein NVS2B16_31440 [Chloroflexota bacterium]
MRYAERAWESGVSVRPYPGCPAPNPVERILCMIGGSLLRDLGMILSDAGDTAWRDRGKTHDGELIWECTFAGKRYPHAFLVTVILDPQSGTTRTLYAAHTVGADQPPRIPLSIRRSVDAFVQRLRHDAAAPA